MSGLAGSDEVLRERVAMMMDRSSSSTNLSAASSTFSSMDSMAVSDDDDDPDENDDRGGTTMMSSSSSSSSNGNGTKPGNGTGNGAAAARIQQAAAEQRRRNSINSGFDELQRLVPVLQPKFQGHRFSKATVLAKTAAHVSTIIRQSTAYSEEVNLLRQEAMALAIVNARYQMAIHAQQSASAQATDAMQLCEADTSFQRYEPALPHGNVTSSIPAPIGWLPGQPQLSAPAPQVLVSTALGSVSPSSVQQISVTSTPLPTPDEAQAHLVKFQLFRHIIENLFATFSPAVSLNSYDAMSASILAWVEEHCHPDRLRDVSLAAFCTVAGDYFVGPPST
ncbi:hypothetical protein CAOG_07309 [Capsaspora owczarzaki ATCC 30864]|uniref:BHLH domain-containing protein n=1 Tax=Capsaspora owczarzaki (strain ATCC 30864) TaxID=595528 RepID=A0A0D2UR02_CAPO3|nr:hypothetical protein CAOG_07309 [Capsaspora owczarzaki ATCC 30864]KJE97451.1 hypothetical protein CAOG_007309 [Capsaspora owczarzaki ATCC 30864]|eukprot:XP_004343168.1 hypothetical protein CAOG_07309 [Capsaspora owczarzaki ATCC 30864]